MDEIFYAEAPAVNDGDDPRTMAYVSVDLLVVDQNVQRPVTVERIRDMGDWDWTIAETPTVTERDDGTMVVTEGQHRVTKRQQEQPGTRMWVAILGDITDERDLALRISRGRRKHTPYDEWLLHVGQGLPHEVAAEQVLAELGLSVSSGGAHSSPTAIGSITTISQIIHAYADADAGAAVLRAVLNVLMQAFPDEKRRWDRLLLLTVARIIRTNPGILETGRLIDRLGRQTALRWVQLAAARRPGQPAIDVIGQAVVDEYNRSLRTRRIEW